MPVLIPLVRFLLLVSQRRWISGYSEENVSLYHNPHIAHTQLHWQPYGQESKALGTECLYM